MTRKSTSSTSMSPIEGILSRRLYGSHPAGIQNLYRRGTSQLNRQDSGAALFQPNGIGAVKASKHRQELDFAAFDNGVGPHGIRTSYSQRRLERAFRSN